MPQNKLVIATIAALVVPLTGVGVLGQTTDAQAASTTTVQASTQSINPACAAVPTTTTESDGVPGPVFYKRLQCLGSLAGYQGPIDGVMGPNSWIGVSAQLAKGGYYRAPALYGWESTEVVRALQRWAAANGRYSGPIDGVWGPNSYRGAAWALNRSF
ncbi:hypothetical protein [Curtobacterium sp. Leaf261]|uniref:hypothetical protein n=1 Tax=Curtobacterium sp. Leaf261 TaxID=1736311 RepID=UPI0006FFC9FB|nr:hypothetical protein [Curtobacterium sp. Leaf261]KQO63567.1 hypothetical protein ASF23_04850 [Curtobacterium sp. Leaf261]